MYNRRNEMIIKIFATSNRIVIKEVLLIFVIFTLEHFVICFFAHCVSKFTLYVEITTLCKITYSVGNVKATQFQKVHIWVQQNLN